jgi:hypothetical protein
MLDRKDIKISFIHISSNYKLLCPVTAILDVGSERFCSMMTILDVGLERFCFIMAILDVESERF